MRQYRADYPKKSGSFNNDQNVYFLVSFKFFVKFFWFYPDKLVLYVEKALVRAIIPEKMSKFVSAVQKILYMGDFWDFGSFKKIFSKKNFFRLRIVQFA